MQFFKKHLAGDHGANMVEYSLIVALVALMAFAAVTLLGDSTSDTFTTAAAALDAGDAVGLGGDDPVETGQNDSPDINGSGDVDQNQDHGQDQDDQSQDQDNQGQDQDDQGQDQDDQDDRGQDDDQGQNEDEDQLDLSDDEQDEDEPDAGDQGQDDAGSNGEQGGQGGGAGDGDENADEDEPAYTGPAPAGSSSELYWWDSHNTKGQWKAAVSFSNETNRHQYLTLEITKIDEKGKSTTTTGKDFYVAAGSSSTYTHWSNDIDKNGQKVTGVVEVQVRVVSVRTSDQNWKTYSYDVNGAPASVTVPSLP